MVKLGIAGKIGAGKSIVASYLKDLGWHVVEADAIGHRLLRDADVKRELERRFGPGVFDASGEVERRALLTAALAQEDGMDHVNGLLWPRITAILPGELGDHSPVALEAAVLLQAGWDAFLDRVLVIKAPRELRAQRLAHRFAGDPHVLEMLMDLQDDYLQMEEGADYYLNNHADEAELVQKVKEIPEVKSCLN